ncbi:hypothetical protein [Nocardia africana]|uniref:Uncharacterized protein n=1 Tax=Nocardia africana TaxID=134964 RepID=A0A378WU21_9NOCA|nr:hypothetical protein [Nocardia africana]MCC3313788.1 hypothetical protein [Nocardia africana]SUA44830.1 Uncharacterised protein [Nocardia africana]
MTSFATDVAAALHAHAGTPSWPATRPSMPKSPQRGAEDHIVLRTAAEQLVAEANAVLGAGGHRITFDDESGPGRLGFRLGFGSGSARIVTTFVRDYAITRLLGDGLRSAAPRELAGTAELHALITFLVADPYGRTTPAG